MCGINGIVSKEPLISDNPVRAMNSVIVHRGPDDEGAYFSPHVCLGMRRLSIIDLSTGQQPAYNEDRSLVIVFNGEIYNYRELRKMLTAHGHVFTTESDTEVIVHLYEEKGVRAPSELQGMFAFAIYDIQKKELFLARDRLGKKPLYYTLQGSRFYFASELKSILTQCPGPFGIDVNAMNTYFAFTFIPAPLTIYSGIFKAEAGGWMKVSSDLTISNGKYWNLSAFIGSKTTIDDKKECEKQLRDLLYDSVRQ